MTLPKVTFNLNFKHCHGARRKVLDFIKYSYRFTILSTNSLKTLNHTYKL